MARSAGERGDDVATIGSFLPRTGGGAGMTDLSRRQFLAAGGGLGLAGLVSACGSPVATSLTGGQPATADVIFWNLFGGGDGANMATMVAKFQKASGRTVEATLLSWGNPYYTKL